jgi:hypothetical protein
MSVQFRRAHPESPTRALMPAFKFGLDPRCQWPQWAQWAGTRMNLDPRLPLAEARSAHWQLPWVNRTLSASVLGVEPRWHAAGPAGPEESSGSGLGAGPGMQCRRGARAAEPSGPRAPARPGHSLSFR